MLTMLKLVPLDILLKSHTLVLVYLTGNEYAVSSMQQLGFESALKSLTSLLSPIFSFSLHFPIAVKAKMPHLELHLKYDCF